MVDRIAARGFFDQAIELQARGRSEQALAKFTAATDADPTMADAWLGRVVAGEATRDNLSRAYEHGEKLRNEASRKGTRLEAVVPVGPYVTITVTDRPQVGIALAGMLVDDGEYQTADDLLNDPVLVSDPRGHQWQQYVRAYLMHSTQRWPDVISEAARPLPYEAINQPDVKAAVNVFAALAAASLGQSQVALDLADDPPTQNPIVLADLHYTRGMVYRQLGNEDKAKEHLGKATINGQLIPLARNALKDDGIQLKVVDESEIGTRTDEWDAATQKTTQEQQAEALDARRTVMLAEALEMMGQQIGLEEVKLQVNKLKASVRVAAERQVQGLPVVKRTHHLIFAGPPGTGKTTIARVVAKIYCALGILNKDTVKEVTRSDLVGQHIGDTEAKTNAVIDSALDGVLFLDEAYALTATGMKNDFGYVAVDTLLTRMENDRDRLVVIAAGYVDEMDSFLDANTGLASRFTNTIKFPSYNAAEIVGIGELMADVTQHKFTTDARQLLIDTCGVLYSTHVLPIPRHRDGPQPSIKRPLLDIAGNGRFMRNVIEQTTLAQEFRIDGELDRGFKPDMSILTLDDMRPALAGVLRTALRSQFPTELDALITATL